MPPSSEAKTEPGDSYCRFTPGRSAASVDGSASLGLTGIEIDLGAGQPRRVWHYAGLKTLEPIRPNAIDVLLTSNDEPGASLFVQGRDFAANLKGYAPHLSARTIGRRWQWGLVLAAILGAAIVASFAAGWSPIKSIAGALPESWRQRLGDAAREPMTEGHKQCVDPDGLAALARLTGGYRKLLPSANRSTSGSMTGR